MVREFKTLPIVRSLAIVGAFLITLMLLPPRQASPATVEEIVQQFFPNRLIVESEKDFQQGGPRPFKTSTHVLADLDGIGIRNYVVAAYTNGFSAAIRVLKQQGTTFVLVHEPNLPLLSGIFPAIELIDIDNDKRPEVVVSFTSARGPAPMWVFKWTGSELRMFGPSFTDEHGDTDTVLVNAGFVDLDGDGVLEIIQPPQDGAIPPGLEDKIPADTFRIYKFDGQRFNLIKSPNYFGTFFRRTGAPAIDREDFPVNRTDIPYVLKIMNGDGRGRNRVSSAEIRVNDAVVAGPNRFSQQVAEITVPVTLQKSNQLSVELRGAPGGQITIFVEAQP